MSNPTSNFGWQMPTPTDLVTDLPADFEVFGQAVDSSLADLKGGTTGQVLSKNSNTDMDFVWVTDAAGDITGVTAGTGISGGGTSGTVTITNSMATEITAKGDLIVGTGSATFDNLAAGADGSSIVADSSTSTGLRYQASYAGGKNSLINANMNIAQRGTSTAGVTATQFVVDRWGAVIETIGTWTVSQETDAPAGFGSSAKMLCTTADASPAAADRLIFRQQIEGQNLQQYAKGTASAKSMAISFWVKSNVTGTYILALLDSDNSRSISASYTINASATWEYKTVIFAGDTTGAFTNDNGRSLDVNFWLGAGSNNSSGTLGTTWASTVAANIAVGQTNLAAATNNYWQVTGVQLEVGNVPTQFSLFSGTFQGELAACQRYFYKTYPQSVTPGTATNYIGSAIGTALTTAAMITPVRYAVTMRTTPTVTIYHQDGTVNAVYYILTGAKVTVTGAAFASDGGFWQIDAASTLTANAVYYWHYTASAEL